MPSARALRAVPIAAICAIALVLGACAAPDETASSESSLPPVRSDQTPYSANEGTEPADAQGNRDESEEPMETSTMYITARGNRFEVKLEDNSSAAALVKALESGPLTVRARDYGGFEKVGDLGMSLPTNDRQMTTAPGDVILYQGDKITVYYDTNSWNLTKLGHIENAEDIEEKLGSGNVELTLSLD